MARLKVNRDFTFKLYLTTEYGDTYFHCKSDNFFTVEKAATDGCNADVETYSYDVEIGRITAEEYADIFKKRYYQVVQVTKAEDADGDALRERVIETIQVNEDGQIEIHFPIVETFIG